MLPRDLGQTQGVTWRADKHRRAYLLHGTQALQRIHAPPWHSQRAEQLRAFVGRPEADERAEAEGQEHNVILAHPRRAVDTCPALRPPVPAFLRIEDLQRAASGPRCLMETHICAQWIGEVGAK